ncbi:MAG: hypothetical protein J6B87_06115 [Clostridia bacterium]|nr:hypothetical protein [Clostridia bacterium]
MSHQSLATIDSPEFINLQPLDINPLMSSCEIKVLYIGGNRNHSYITKEVASDMAKTLRGAPIVGYYKEEKEDFADHGDRIIFDDEGVKFECLTRPYGFVAPDAKVWFQKFEEQDDFGNSITREYLMTTGYLWTGQFEECKSAITKEGKGQSMELDSESLDGHWSTDTKTGMDFFIINDAIFSKLCILGDDVEPCFEGAKVTAPDVSTSFSKVDDGFKKTLYTMMQELKFALEGGKNMNNDNPEVVETLENNEINEEVVVETETAEVVEEEVPAVESNEVVENVENNEENQNSEVELPEDSFVKKDEDEEDKEEDNDSNEDNAQDDEDEDEKKKKEYSMEELETELSELQEKYSALEKDYQALVEFKQAVDNEKKDALINSFYMLSDEDKKEVIENKEKYSLEDIEAKLSIICVRKKVNFDLEDTSKNDKEIEEEKEAVTTYALENQESSVPAWISALRKTQNDRNN